MHVVAGAESLPSTIAQGGREMNLFKMKKKVSNVHILVRFWQEDGVWNASAMDIYVAVFGNSFEEARSNFEEALTRHFEVLREMQQLPQTIRALERAANARGFYQRIEPGSPYETFQLPTHETHFAHA